MGCFPLHCIVDTVGRRVQCCPKSEKHVFIILRAFVMFQCLAVFGLLVFQCSYLFGIPTLGNTQMSTTLRQLAYSCLVDTAFSHIITKQANTVAYSFSFTYNTTHYITVALSKDRRQDSETMKHCNMQELCTACLDQFNQQTSKRNHSQYDAFASDMSHSALNKRKVETTPSTHWH